MPFDALGALNTAAGTTGLGLNAVCNVIAGTTGLDAVGALNVKNGTSGVGWQQSLSTLNATLTRTNLVPNPSEEGGVTGWLVVNGGVLSSVSDGTAAVGSNFGRSTLTAVASPGAAFGGAANPIAVSPSTAYTTSMYMRCPVSSPTQFTAVRVMMLWYTSTSYSTFISNALTNGTLIGNGWLRLSVTATSPATANAVRVQGIFVGTAVAGQLLDWDGVLTEASSSMGTYFDGSSSEARWNGAAGLSTSTVMPLGLGV